MVKLVGILGFLLVWGGSVSVMAGQWSLNGDNTVTDSKTGLMWQQVDDGTTRTWEQALQYCESLELAGYTDWKLPNIKELQSIVDYSRSNPSIRLLYFPNTKSSSYWSSTVVAYNSDSAGIVVFDKGAVGSGISRGGARYVRCVRHGQ
ncbi:DUF1566 domain-containing protein [Deltaproteobacteria bacterium TL4]